MVNKFNHNKYLESTCTIQSRHDIQKNSGCRAVEIKLFHGVHDISVHKLIQKIIISAQCFEKMPKGTVRMSLGYNILNYIISITHKVNNKQRKGLVS